MQSPLVTQHKPTRPSYNVEKENKQILHMLYFIPVSPFRDDDGRKPNWEDFMYITELIS